MSKKRTQTSLFITAIAAVLCCFGCDFSFGGGTCTSNPDHKAQSGCTCPCNNNTAAPACTDEHNVCCYDNGGLCKHTTTTTPKPDAGAATAMAPSNRDGVRAHMDLCFNEKGVCANAYPVSPCQQFFEQVTFHNFADVTAAAPIGNSVPTLVVVPPFDIPYPFTYPPKTVPWDSLGAGQNQQVGVEIHTANSAGMDGKGLDPGAQQCDGSQSFMIQLLQVPSVTLNPNEIEHTVLVEGSSDLPFGACPKGTSC